MYMLIHNSVAITLDCFILTIKSNFFYEFKVILYCLMKTHKHTHTHTHTHTHFLCNVLRSKKKKKNKTKQVVAVMVPNEGV